MNEIVSFTSLNPQTTIMKNRAIPFFFLLPLLCTAQNYTPFSLISTNAWNEVSSLGLPGNDGTVGAGGNERTGFTYQLLGDTIIDDQQYTKVYSKNNWFHRREHVPQNGESITIVTEYNLEESYVLIGGLRQDSIEKKVYFINLKSGDWYMERCFTYNPPFGQEALLYDFNLAQNDLVQIGDNTFTLANTQIVTLEDGSQRQSYQFEESDYTWIEGIGSAIGLFGPWQAAPFESGCGLLCYSEAETTLFMPNENFGGPSNLNDNCNMLIIATHNLWPKEHVMISPNPFKDFLQINLHPELPTSQLSLQIYNPLGQLELQESLTQVSQINTSSLKNGIHLVVIISDNKLVYRANIIKQ